MTTYSRKRKYISLHADTSTSPPPLSPPSSLQSAEPPGKRPLQAWTGNVANLLPVSAQGAEDIKAANNIQSTESKTIPPTVPISACPPKDKIAKPKPKHRKKLKLTQTTIDLGQNPRISCPHPRCGMYYIPSDKRDAALHRRHHASVVGTGLAHEGVDVPSSLLKDPSVRRVPMRPLKFGVEENKQRRKHGASIGGGADCVLVVTRESSSSARRFAKDVLEAAEEELGAVRTDERQLWSCFHSSIAVTHAKEIAREKGEVEEEEQHTKFEADALPTPPPSSPLARETVAQKVAPTTQATKPSPAPRCSEDFTQRENRYTIHLYINSRGACTAILLTERIHSARRVLPPSPSRIAHATCHLDTDADAHASNEPPPLELAPQRTPAHTGISRIYVTPACRGVGIANALLDSLLLPPIAERAPNGARADDDARVKGRTKEDIAFSAPTQMGRRLAERWFNANQASVTEEKRGGWMIYDESDGFGDVCV